MRLVIFTEEEAILLAPMLDGVLGAFTQHDCRIYVFPRPKSGGWRDLRWAVRTFGLTYALRTGLEYAYLRVLECGERLGFWRSKRVPSVAAATRRRGVPLVRWRGSPNSPEVVAALREFAPDV